MPKTIRRATAARLSGWGLHYSPSSSGYHTLELHHRHNLEEDIEDLLGEAGEVTGGGGSLGPGGWNIDLELKDGAGWEEWADRLVAFLREQGVSDDTYLEIFPPDWVEGTKGRRVQVFSN